MKKGIFFILFLCFQLCFGQGLEKKEIWKNHPGLQELLQKYWQAFQVAKVADQSTGKSLAALIKLGDVEEELENRGFDDRLLEELRTQAQDAYTEMLQKKEERFSKESFYFTVDTLEKVKPETTEGLVYSLKNYARENTSRSEGLERFLAVLNQQESLIDPASRFAYFKLSMSFYLLAEAQNFIGKDEALTTKLNQFSGLALAELLIASESLNVRLTSAELHARALAPVEATFFASGIPDLKEVAQSLIDHYKTSKAEPPVRSYLESLRLAFKNRNHKFYAHSLAAPLITAAVATFITYEGITGPEGWQALQHGPNLISVVGIWGLAIYLFSDGVFGFKLREHFRSYYFENKRAKAIQSNKKDVVQSLQKSCRIAVQ